MATALKNHCKSPFPALNVSRRNEPVTTETVHSDAPAINNRSTSTQILVGAKTLLTDVHSTKRNKQFVNTLKDSVRKRGAMDKLTSDRAQVEIIKRVHDILRALCVNDWQSEPERQHQNPSERRHQHVKRLTNALMDRAGSPPSMQLLATQHACFALDHSYCTSVNDMPLSTATGSTHDVSPLLQFRFWKPVFFNLIILVFLLIPMKKEDNGLVCQIMLVMMWSLKCLVTQYLILLADAMLDLLMMH